jgi:hypothetical protein
VGIHAAHLRLDQATRDVACIRRRNIQALEHTAAVIEQVLMPVPA